MSSFTLDDSGTAPELGAAPGANSAAERTRSLVLIGVITAASAVLWFWQLDSKSFDRDEGFTASTVLRSWGSLARLSIDYESQGALHAAMLKVWTVFGTSEVALRSLSVVCLVALVPVTATIGWRLASPRVGVLSAALLAVNGTVVSYAQNARTYSLSMLLAGVATLFFVLDVERPRRAMLVGWTVCCVMLAYSNLVAGLFVACYLVSLRFLPSERRLVRRRVVAAAVVVVCTLPLAILVSRHDEGQGLHSFGLGPYRDVLYTFGGRAGLVGLAATAVMAVLALRVTARAWRTGQNAVLWAHVLLISWAVLPLAVLTIVGPIFPMIIGRYLVFCLPGFLIYGAIGLDDALRTSGGNRTYQVIRATPVVLALLAGVLGLHYWYTDGGEEDWRATAQHVFGAAVPGDRIIFPDDDDRLYFEYYNRNHGDPSTWPKPFFPADTWGEFETGDQTHVMFNSAVIDQLLQERRGRIWVVLGRNHPQIDEYDALVRPLTEAYVVLDRREFKGDVEALLLDRASKS